MCDKEQLVGYLYDELSAAERAACQLHLASCAGCRAEIEELQGVRQHLAAWAPPDADLGVGVPRPRPVPVSRRVPAWGLAAAASIFLLAGAAAVANLEIRYGADGVVVRTGWAPGVPPAGDAGEQAAMPATPAAEELTQQIAALEARLRQLEETRAGEEARPVPVPAGLSAEQLAAVRKLLAESESRQRAERALQITQVWNDFNAARTSDFVRFHEALGRAQGLTNYQLKQHKDTIDSLYRVSLQR